MARLSAAARRRLPESAFALPGRRYPIEDREHAGAALARVAQWGTKGEKARVRAAVHREYPWIDIDRSNPRRKPAPHVHDWFGGVASRWCLTCGKSEATPEFKRMQIRRGPYANRRGERSNPDNPSGGLVGTVLTLGVVVGGAAFLLNNPNLVGQFFSAVGSAAHAAVGPGGPGGPQGGPSQPPAPVTPGANTGDNQFNFNADQSQSYAWQNTGAGNTTGHFGVGHVGPGGTFSVTVSARAGGGPFGIGRVDQWQQIYQGTIDVGNDTDWTGYGIDFTGNTPPLGMSSEDVQASIDGLSGEHYANLTIKAHQGA